MNDLRKTKEQNMTITKDQQAAIAAKLEGMTLPSGLGDEHSACSIAAINLALTGKLTDSIPACMSPVIGRWIITTQDSMPTEMRNSRRWKSLLPLAAGTGREHEQERLTLIMDWMWGKVLPTVQPIADDFGFGDEWRRMTTERGEDAAMAVWAAYAADAAYSAAYAADAAAWAAKRSAYAAASDEEDAAGTAASVSVWASEAAWSAGAAARVTATSAAADEVETAAGTWEKLDPCGLLEMLISVGEQK
jgi:hypothetical protein